MTTKSDNRVVVIVGSVAHDRRTHVERLNYWDEFPNPAHLPGIGKGFMDAVVIEVAAEEDRDDGQRR